MRASKRPKDDDIPDSDSEFSGEPRTDGSNARVFSSIVEAGGYIPHHKEPPRYIRIKAHNKRNREFNRMFLAQELVGTHPKATQDGVEEKGPIVTVSVAGAGGRRRQRTGGAIWATEFSKDGRYFAAAGKDAVVRVWAVIVTQEDRRTEEEEEAASGAVGERLSAPVFKERPVREFAGHTGEVLDLSWSKNNFLLSTSMDKTVRLWHVSRKECLCTFKHKDLVTKVAFHPTDDRFFLAGSLDTMLRLWSIPDKSVAYTVQLPDLITAVAFSPDGKTAIAGVLNGLCMLYETEGLKYSSQIHAKSSRGKNSRGSKITGIQTMIFAPGSNASGGTETGEVRVLISTNDSRIRVYSMKDGSLEVKFKGHENTSTQISASFSDDGTYVISGSEDRKTFIWNMSPADAENKDKQAYESFNAHGEIVTTAVFAPTKTRMLLSGSGDPIYDLCNPPPVTLLPTDESTAVASQTGLSELSQNHEPLPTPTLSIKKPEESPGYIARSTHYDGNIIVTTDEHGIIKIFRQDCAFAKRRHENWETGSAFSKKLGAHGTGLVGRSASILTRTSASSAAHSRRGSLSQPLPPGVLTGGNSAHGSPQVSSDMILSWRQNIEGGRPSSLVGSIGTPTRSERSISPSKNMRTPASGSKGNLAADARKQQYATVSPNHARSHNYNSNNPSESMPASPISSVASPGLPHRTDSLSVRLNQNQDESRPSKEGDPREEEGGPASPPIPSFVFRPADEDDELRLDAAGASYSFWNLNRWRGIAGLKSAIGGGTTNSTGSSSHGHHTRTASEATPSSGLEKDRDKDKDKDRATRRKSVGPTIKSPLANSTSIQLSPTVSHDDGPKGLRRQSMPPGTAVQRDLSAEGNRRPSPLSAGSLSEENARLTPGERDRSPYLRADSVVSKLSSELTSEDDRTDAEEGEEMRCSKCGSKNFKARRVAGRQRLACGRCGNLVEA
ncbi:putative wd repeat domain-containing protein [Phaeoacremonium minimum UCRPA7]|uniref:Putative wd repeat domain-containing protein n=1 Tax=Phaeoacremonium minimum (strain UCR-PA7) TaxID=1286976 RepID=R8BLE2_PHAM7|nr:putative wd repeat domain-containing protein [Phaeoacremonium minimum UCRPA7]EOO00147.1 putative wd repeat domain-containing protein [Phaeoacremonium minimum UCRPA7]